MSNDDARMNWSQGASGGPRALGGADSIVGFDPGCMRAGARQSRGVHARAYIVTVVLWLFAGGAPTLGVVGAAAVGPSGSRMLPWRDEADIGPDAARLRRTLAELCVTELRDISFEGNLVGAVHTLGEAYRRARGRGLSLLIRAGEGRRFSGAGGPHVRMKHRSTTVARAMDDLCRQADLFWEVTPIGIVCFDAWNLEQSRRRMAPGDLARAEAELVEAQKAGDEAGVWRRAEACAWAYAHRNGGTEEPGPFLEVSEGVAPLSAEEVRRGFDSHLQELKKRKWWAVGLDPTRTGRLPREVGIAIQGCVGAERAKLPCWEEGLQFAREAADYIMWTQNCGGKGVVPFPLCRSGDAAFVSAGGFISRVASNTGASHNGWVVDDLGDGSLQVDNSHCGVALYELYEATKEPKFFDMACEAAGWAMVEPIAPNWVYNGMTVYLLGWPTMRPAITAILNRPDEGCGWGSCPGRSCEGRSPGGGPIRGIRAPPSISRLYSPWPSGWQPFQGMIRIGRCVPGRCGRR